MNCNFVTAAPTLENCSSNLIRENTKMSPRQLTLRRTRCIMTINGGRSLTTATVNYRCTLYPHINAFDHSFI